jgi:hypothetical protein
MRLLQQHPCSTRQAAWDPPRSTITPCSTPQQQEQQEVVVWARPCGRLPACPCPSTAWGPQQQQHLGSSSSSSLQEPTQQQQQQQGMDLQGPWDRAGLHRVPSQDSCLLLSS